jgi:hypothetical protein
VRRDVVASRACLAAFKRIVSKELDVGADPGAGEVRQCRCRGRAKRGDTDERQKPGATNLVKVM